MQIDAAKRKKNRFRMKTTSCLDMSGTEGWIDEAIGYKAKRNPGWSESIAVGSRTFVESVEEHLDSKATGRSIIDRRINGSVLREETDPYNPHFEAEKGCLSTKKRLFWECTLYKIR